ncbi:MAG: class I SAM-dependent methyltransferase [Syntrophobacteraceae bacterium]|jgi:ubiquinone/menaquinone biosynthesis C-methylase UbiE
MTTDYKQDKLAELAFFSGHAEVDEYNVFTESSTRKLFERCVQLARIKPATFVADIGCGSGVFSQLLLDSNVNAIGLDLSYPLLVLGRRKYPGASFVVGDAECLPLPTGKADGVLLSGIIHHLPEPSQCAREVFRILKPGGAFIAFDPNRHNPFMYLYRDRSSPFYSSTGVTPNERPVVPERVRAIFADAGFQVAPSDYISMSYRYIADSRMRYLLSMYNTIESILFRLWILKYYRSFVLTYGFKP